MHSKTLINFLVLFSLGGLTAFALISVLGPSVFFLSSTRGEGSNNIIATGLIEEERSIVQRELLELKEKKAFLEGSIFENEKEKKKLDQVLRGLYEEQTQLDVKLLNLGNERDELSEIISDLNLEIDNAKQLESENTLNREAVARVAKLTLELEQLKLENINLTSEIEETKRFSEEQIKKKIQAAKETETFLSAQSSEIIATNEKYLAENEELRKEVAALKLEIEDINRSNTEDQYNRNSIAQKKVGSIKVKEIEQLKALESNFQQLNGLRVIFSGNMIYDEIRGQIVFKADNSIGIPIFQDDFTGSIAGKCGLPIDKEIQNRCSATIIAEFVVENNKLFLRGKEIVEIVRK